MHTGVYDEIHNAFTDVRVILTCQAEGETWKLEKSEDDKVPAWRGWRVQNLRLSKHIWT